VKLLERDAELVRSLRAWFEGHARAFPWRTSPRDPFASLVSEVMLQQTQAARVAERFGAFMARFPTAAALARAERDEVLALWSGLGYYRRARHLHEAARAIVERFAGVTPTDAADLRTLPGVGRYTAGAVASIAGGRPEPIVDGNVARVLLRLEGKALRHGSPRALSWSWARAAALASIAGARAGAFNEGLMELGATVCTPRNPGCGRCPLGGACRARKAGRQDRIPLPKSPARRALLRLASAVVLDVDGRVLVERRPDAGLWGGLWQAPTLDRGATRRALSAYAGAAGLRRVDCVMHRTTHRDVVIMVYRGRWAGTSAPGRRWVSAGDLGLIALATPQRRILESALRASPRSAR